jgi:membrane-bound metal-dependent hydrolase YbcI (DUF457 family)
MTPVGHTLTGLAIGYVAIPRDVPLKPKLLALAVFAFLANVPDLRLTRYIITHSFIVVTIAIVVIVALIKLLARNNPYLSNRMLCGGALAWYSHLVLDSLYDRVGPDGYEAFWPIRDVKLSLPLPWLLQGDKEHILSWHNVSVGLYEILTFGTPLLLVVFAKHYLPRKSATS